MMFGLDVKGFLSSKPGLGFLYFAVFAAAFAAGLGYAVYGMSLRAYTADKGEEQATALQLVDAFVTNYSELRGRFAAADAPVPASFRAHSIELFNRMRGADETLRMRWVGRSGRAIATPPADADMAAIIETLAGEAEAKPVSRLIALGDARVFRTVYPSVATQQSCVDCHNQQQPETPRWRLGELMGAFAIDVPADAFLHRNLRQSAGLGLVIFLSLAGVGLVVALIYFRQLGEREAAWRELRVAKEEAETASRSKSEFLANTSHELRTPLNAIIGFADLLAGQKFGPLGNPRYVGYAVDIRDSGQHLLELINDVLDLSKVEYGKLELLEEPVDVAAAAESCLRLMRPRAEAAQVGLAAELPPGLPALRADDRRLKQILLNLLSNAVKFTPAGGSVVLRARADAEGFHLSVADTGIGIADGDLAKALSPFGQVDSRLARRYSGTGLGLPLTKAMVELHGGRLRIDSRVGAGTTVTVSLPPGRLLPLAVETAA